MELRSAISLLYSRDAFLSQYSIYTLKEYAPLCRWSYKTSQMSVQNSTPHFLNIASSAQLSFSHLSVLFRFHLSFLSSWSCESPSLLHFNQEITTFTTFTTFTIK